MLQELRRLRDNISLESADGAGSLESAAGRLASFFHETKSFIQKHLVDPITDVFSKNDLAVFAKRINKTTYAELRPINLIVPAGLKVDLLTYGRALVKASGATEDLVQHVLKPFGAWVRTKLGNPAGLASLTNNLNISGYQPSNTDALEQMLHGCFVPVNELQAVQMPYGKAVLRNQDWFSLSDVAQQLSNSFSDKTHARVVEEVDQVLADINRLIDRIKEEPETYKVSETTLVALSDTALHVAREVEFYSLLRHRVAEFEVSIKSSREKLEGLLDQQ